MKAVLPQTPNIASRREQLLAALAIGCGLVLIGYLVARGLLREAAGSNSFAALAEAFLNGRLWVDKCPDFDCAVFNGRTFIIFPPLPAFVAMPFVALFGFAHFKGFVFLALAISGASLAMWHAIFRALNVERMDAMWLLAALALASPLFQVTARADGVWFFAQVIGFFLMTASIWAVICRNSLAIAGIFIALALHCRQMAVFYPLFLAVLAMKPGERFLMPSRARIRGFGLAALPFLIALMILFAYNSARFGHPLDIGYSYIVNPGVDTFISRRIAEQGLFSRDYLLFNTLYLFVQGLHFEFSGPLLTQLTGIDKAGSALFVASPWILLAFYSKLDRVFAAGAMTIAIIAGITLFYHSNGADQINTQRYALDWLPILLVLMLRGARPASFSALPLLVTWGIVLNTVAIGLVTFYRLLEGAQG